MWSGGAGKPSPPALPAHETEQSPGMPELEGPCRSVAKVGHGEKTKEMLTKIP